MISTGSRDIDKVIKGYEREITLIYGPGATGKTTLAKTAAISQAKKKKKVLYVDSEGGFSTERIKQLSGENCLDYIFKIDISDFRSQIKQFNRLKTLIEKGNFSLLIIDTIGMHYRVALKKDAYRANKMMDKQMQILSSIVNEAKIPVLVCNQVYSSIEGEGIKPVGGNMIMNWSKKIIELEREPKRRLRLMKPEIKEMFFEIEDKGIKKI